MNKKSAIGIIGGMGPEASVHLYNLLIQKAIRDFGEKNNDDFPEIILQSVPVPDFISDTGRLTYALKMLEKRVALLNKLNVSSLSLACNTAHVLLHILQKNSSTPFISMVDAVVTQVVAQKIKRVGLLSTPSTIASKLYHSPCERFGITVITPNKRQMHVLEKIIRLIIGGKATKQQEQHLAMLANDLQKRGAEAIILGCTELPLIFPKKYSLPVYNSLEILADTLLRNYYAIHEGGEKYERTTRRE